jgi:hypothetical protein
MKIIRRTHRNKRNNQLTITIPKKLLPVTLRHEPELFVELTIFKKIKKMFKGRE